MALTVPPAHIVIFGRPGSGKSSLAERLGAAHGSVLVRTGELLRGAVRRGDPLGRQVEALLAGGNLVPDPLIVELLEQALQAPGTKRLLFDGFPRTMGQVPLLEQFERKLDFQVECYLEIAVSRAEAVARMTGRRVCPACGATYHVRARPPQVPETCDRDGTRLDRRKDDAPEVVAQRHQVYDEHTGPVIEHYRAVASDRFVRVDGAQPLEAVFAETCRALGLPAA